MSEHTPGPWKVVAWETGYRIVPMDAYGNSRSDGPIGDVFYTDEHLVCKANARLIAAAPETKEQRDELLEACQAVDKAIDTVETIQEQEALALVVAAINRVTRS